MRNRLRTATAGAVLLLALAGCSSITNPVRLEEFQWSEVVDPTTVDEGIDVSILFGDVFVGGELNTPTRCYGLKASFDKKSSRITLRIEATIQRSTCPEGIGGYHYSAVIRYLPNGTYDLHVIHEVAGDDTREFTESVEVG